MFLKNAKGFSYVELMVTISIISLMTLGGYAVLSSGESSWFTAEAGIQVQESLRLALDKMTTELRQSKLSKVSINNGGGLNSTDEVIFRIPVICHTGDNLLNASGDVAYWRATLKWGCWDAVCMDADDSCATLDYDFIKYAVISGNKLVRQVWQDVDLMVRQDVMANNISDFQASFGASSISLTIKAEVKSVLNRPVTAIVQNSVDFRNK